MSAYLVEDTTINRIVTWLSREVATNRHLTLDRLAGKYKIDLQSDKWEETLAQAMFQLNCAGVTSRYGEEKAETCKASTFTYTPVPCSSLVQVFKSLQCWLYQCTEGTVPHAPLYRFFKEVEKYFAVKIVMDLPEYKTAAWG